jgi:hypothetical protein
MARRTSTAWFGPKRRVGWGWTPISWQGWAVTAAWTVVVVGVSLVLAMRQQILAMLLFEVVAIVLLLVVASLTGDGPGGPGFDA